MWPSSMAAGTLDLDVLRAGAAGGGETCFRIYVCGFWREVELVVVVSGRVHVAVTRAMWPYPAHNVWRGVHDKRRRFRDARSSAAVISRSVVSFMSQKKLKPWI